MSRFRSTFTGRLFSILFMLGVTMAALAAGSARAEDLTVYHEKVGSRNAPPGPICVAQYHRYWGNVPNRGKVKGRAYRLGDIKIIEPGDSVTWGKAATATEADRWVVWTDWLPNGGCQYISPEISEGAWDGGYKNSAENINGAVFRVYVRNRGGLTSVERAFTDAWASVWNALTPSGSTVTVHNPSSTRWYAAEFQKKLHGKASRLQDVGWVEPGSSRTFTRRAMGPGYTERHLIFNTSGSMGQEASHAEFQSWQSTNTKGINALLTQNVVYIDYDSKGFSSGFWTTEWVAKLIADRGTCHLLSAIESGVAEAQLPAAVRPLLDVAMNEVTKLQNAVVGNSLQTVANRVADTVKGQLPDGAIQGISDWAQVVNTSAAAIDSAFTAEAFCGNLTNINVPPVGVDTATRAFATAFNGLSSAVRTELTSKGAYMSYAKTSTLQYKNAQISITKGKAVRIADLASIANGATTPVVTKYISIAVGAGTGSGVGGSQAKNFTYYLGANNPTIYSLFDGAGLSAGITGAPAPLAAYGLNIGMSPTSGAILGFGLDRNQSAQSLGGTVMGSIGWRKRE